MNTKNNKYSKKKGVSLGIQLLILFQSNFKYYSPNIRNIDGSISLNNLRKLKGFEDITVHDLYTIQALDEKKRLTLKNNNGIINIYYQKN